MRQNKPDTGYKQPFCPKRVDRHTLAGLLTSPGIAPSRSSQWQRCHTGIWSYSSGDCPGLAPDSLLGCHRDAGHQPKMQSKGMEIAVKSKISGK